MKRIKAVERTLQARHLAAFLIALFAAIASVGCSQQSSNTNTSNANTSPQKAQPQSSPLNKGLGETPIVMSGGSVHLDLNSSTFKTCAGAPVACPSPSPSTNTVYYADGTLTDAYYYDDDKNNNETPTQIKVPSSGDITVVIECKDTSPGGGDGIITIKSIVADKRVYIEFDEGKFKPRSPKNGVTLDKRTSKVLNKIESVTITGTPNKITLPNKATLVFLGISAP